MLALPNIPDAAQTSGESAFAVHNAFKQGGAGLGGDNTGLPTLKQGNAELSLERPNRRREARSSNVETLGCGADTARLADRTKIRQLVEVHVSPRSPSSPRIIEPNSRTYHSLDIPRKERHAELYLLGKT